MSQLKIPDTELLHYSSPVSAQVDKLIEIDSDTNDVPYNAPLAQLPDSDEDEYHSLHLPLRYCESQEPLLLSDQQDQTQLSQHIEPSPHVKSYLICSIIACVFCFCPLGLFAVLYSLIANKYYRKGDLVEARYSAKNAIRLVIASVVVGTTLITIVIILTMTSVQISFQ
nr:hypothetical protein BgiMline_006531 [Biomphalaria glabrata]